MRKNSDKLSKNVEIRGIDMHKRPYTIGEIAEVIPAIKYIIADETAKVGTLLYDSRRLADHVHGLFFALAGRRDGHDYISEAYAAGVRNFVALDGRVDTEQFPEANFIIVVNTLDALQTLATHHRNRFTYPVIGITGSNGKTIVKEWLYQLLSPEYRVIRSPKSFNSQIGVALSLWQLDEVHDLAIIEAGISRVGEMEALRRMIQPDIAVLTTIGPAHDDGFASRDDKVREKLLLFEGSHQAIYPSTQIDRKQVPPCGRQITWGEDQGATLHVIRYELLGEGTCRVYARYKDREVHVTIPFIDGASRENAICCWAVLLAMGYEQPVIENRMNSLQTIEMRLQLKKGINHCTIIDDSYSNDLSSLSIALDFLKQQHQHPVRTLVLSDLPGISGSEEEIYKKISKLLENSGVSKLISVGPDLANHRAKFHFLEFHAFPDTQALVGALPGLQLHDELILLKGARKYAFERVSRLLTAKSHDTVLEINLSALEHNLNQYRSLLPKAVKLMAMVKAFSYGSGSYEIANLLQFNKVDYLAVAYVDEGVELRKAGIQLPIMVMSPNDVSFEALLTHGLEPELYSFQTLSRFVELLDMRGIEHYPIHIKVDTGMHRLGFSTTDIEDLIDYLVQTNRVNVQSVFSHLAASGDARHDAFTARQLADFDKFTVRLASALGYPIIRHIANTAGIRRWPQAHLDMVRLGIGLYGIGTGETDTLPLQQANTLKTTITQIRQVPAGESVGYGRSGMMVKDSAIATVNIGYADGYDRRFGNGVGYMVVNGMTVPTVGDICMDMTMLDISEVDAREGDEVVVFGDIDRLAERIGTIPYELLTGISQRVKRVYFYG